MAVQAAKNAGVSIYLGMWVDRPDTFDLEMKALQNLLDNSDLSGVEAIIVGSEVLYRKDTDAATFIDYIKKVKELVGPKGIQVTSADVYYELTGDLIAELDFVMM